MDNNNFLIEKTLYGIVNEPFWVCERINPHLKSEPLKHLKSAFVDPNQEHIYTRNFSRPLYKRALNFGLQRLLFLAIFSSRPENSSPSTSDFGVCFFWRFFFKTRKFISIFWYDRQAPTSSCLIGKKISSSFDITSFRLSSSLHIDFSL